MWHVLEYINFVNLYKHQYPLKDPFAMRVCVRTCVVIRRLVCFVIWGQLYPVRFCFRRVSWTASLVTCRLCRTSRAGSTWWAPSRRSPRLGPRSDGARLIPQAGGVLVSDLDVLEQVRQIGNAAAKRGGGEKGSAALPEALCPPLEGAVEGKVVTR